MAHSTVTAVIQVQGAEVYISSSFSAGSFLTEVRGPVPIENQFVPLMTCLQRGRPGSKREIGFIYLCLGPFREGEKWLGC